MTLEIIIPVDNADERLARTAAALAEQIDRRFEVLLSVKTSESGSEHLMQAVKLLGAAGIAVRQLTAPAELRRIEHWNWAHSQTGAEWLKPLQAGEILKPKYVARLRQRLEEKPNAHLVRCDMEQRTEWGVETVHAPFAGEGITAAQFGEFFPARVDWISRSANMAYNRTAWLATGGYCNQLPALASLNLNVTLALHDGLENIAETLVSVESADRLALNEAGARRVNLAMELWLILRQARNYCIAARVPWRCRWPWGRAFTAWMGHW